MIIVFFRTANDTNFLFFRMLSCFLLFLTTKKLVMETANSIKREKHRIILFENYLRFALIAKMRVSFSSIKKSSLPTLSSLISFFSSWSIYIESLTSSRLESHDGLADNKITNDDIKKACVYFDDFSICPIFLFTEFYYRL